MHRVIDALDVVRDLGFRMVGSTYGNHTGAAQHCAPDLRRLKSTVLRPCSSVAPGVASPEPPTALMNHQGGYGGWGASSKQRHYLLASAKTVKVE